MTTASTPPTAPPDPDPTADAPLEDSPSAPRGYLALLRAYKGRLALLAVTAGSGGVFEAAILVLIARIAFAVSDDEGSVDLAGGWSLDLGPAFAVAVGLTFFTIVLQILATWQSASLGALVIQRIRTQLSAAFLEATWASQHDERAGRLQELLTTFIRGGAQLVAATTLGTIAVCNLLALLIVSMFIDVFVAIGLLVVVVVLAVSVRPLRKLVRREATVTADAGMRLATTLSETSQLGMEMHVFNVQPHAQARLAVLIDENAQTNRRLAFLNQFTPTTYGSLSYLALLGGLGVIAAIGVSDLSSVGAVTLIMLRTLRYGQTLQINATQVNANLPFLDHLDDELERYQRAKAHDGGETVEKIGDIRLDDVSFAYHPGTPVLNNVDAVIDEYEMVGVVGPSGSGKSTLVQLLLGLRSPTSGAVFADGRDIRTLSRAEWARHVTFVPQQAHLIAGTVTDNIRFFRDDVTDERIEHAARLASLHDDVMGWPEGYAREVGEQGGHLSGGQQQRLVIARALVEDPDVLILDEPTSALDVRSEYLVRQTLNELRKHMTVIIIAHRLSTLESCDRIMVVMDGELKAFDAPDRLAETNTFYRDALEMSGVR